MEKSITSILVYCVKYTIGDLMYKLPPDTVFVDTSAGSGLLGILMAQRGFKVHLIGNKQDLCFEASTYINNSYAIISYSLCSNWLQVRRINDNNWVAAFMRYPLNVSDPITRRFLQRAVDLNCIAIVWLMHCNERNNWIPHRFEQTHLEDLGNNVALVVWQRIVPKIIKRRNSI